MSVDVNNNLNYIADSRNKKRLFSFHTAPVNRSMTSTLNFLLRVQILSVISLREQRGEARCRLSPHRCTSRLAGQGMA